MPEILKKDFIEKPYFLLKNSDGENCHNNANGCRFNTDSNKKAYIIGDSHMASIMFDLKNRLLNKNYQIITRTKGGCIYFPGFNLVHKKTTKVYKNCDDIYFQRIKEELLLEKNSVIVLGGRFPLYLSNKWFDNLEGGREENGKEWDYNYVANDNNINFKDSFKLELLEILKNNKVIIMYPIPEVGWYPSRQIYLQWINKKNKLSREFDLKSVDTSFNVFKNRSETSFELLDSIKSNNLFRVYPNKLFCNTKIKNRCITHDKSNFYYDDNDHPSIKGAEMINDLIMEQIKKIELKSN